MTKKKQPIKKCLLVFVGFYSIFKERKKYTWKEMNDILDTRIGIFEMN